MDFSDAVDKEKVHELLQAIIERTTNTTGEIEDAEEALVDIREMARKELSKEGVSVVLDGETGCYGCGFGFEDENVPDKCPNCGREIVQFD